MVSIMKTAYIVETVKPGIQDLIDRSRATVYESCPTSQIRKRLVNVRLERAQELRIAFHFNVESHS